MATYSQELWYGKRPVHRTNPKAGQSEYYYMDPRYPNATNGANEIDVPSADTPNPKSAEIQKYLAQYDPDNHKAVYGGEPPVLIDSNATSTSTMNANSMGSFNENNQTQYYPTSTKQMWAQNDFSTSCQDTYLEFDGRDLTLYERGKKIKSWPAQSGKDRYQSSLYQNIPDKGPLPSGQYFANMNEMQHYNDLSLLEKIATYISKLGISTGPWRGGTEAWGNDRVWIKPDENTQTYGRDKFTIHGGAKYGSAGCIDLAGQMDDFVQTVRGKGIMPLNVSYPMQSWIPRSQD